MSRSMDTNLETRAMNRQNRSFNTLENNHRFVKKIWEENPKIIEAALVALKKMNTIGGHC